MSTRALAARAERASARPSRFTQVRAMIARFAPADRARLDRIAAMHPYLEDVLWSFPGLAHALSCGAYEEAVCERVRALICAGAPVQRAADVIGLPYWLRRLPPEAFAGRIPDLPRDPGFGLHICNSLPRPSKTSTNWLELVAVAYRVCDADFALWVARNFSAFGSGEQRPMVAVLGLLCWHTARPNAGAGLYVPAGWTAKLSAYQACQLATLWLCEMQMILFTQARTQMVAHANAVDIINDIQFVRLRTPQDLAEEGAAMSHCVATYSPQLARGGSFIWSLRARNEDRLATLEIRLKPNGRPVMVQLRARANEDVSHQIWQAVQIWLAGWSEPMPTKVVAVSAHPDARTWAHLWKPYWREKGMGMLLPLHPSKRGLETLMDAVDNLD